MTAQTADLLLLEGRAERLQCLPLQGYLDARGIDLQQHSTCYSTALYRGYEAVWEMVDGRLFLIGLLDAMSRPFDPGIVFGERALPIPADWFSGRLEIGQGEALSYLHMGWGCDHASLLRLYLKQGRVVARRRYDRTRLLRRRFDAFVAEHPDWLELLEQDAARHHQPLGGLTPAGVQALGRPELMGRGLPPMWTAGLTDDESAEIAGRVLQHCVRAPGGVVANGTWAPRQPAGALPT